MFLNYESIDSKIIKQIPHFCHIMCIVILFGDKNSKNNLLNLSLFWKSKWLAWPVRIDVTGELVPNDFLCFGCALTK